MQARKCAVRATIRYGALELPCYTSLMYAYQRLEAWKRAHRALMLTLKATDKAYHPRSKALFDQLKRAAISVEANIVEGYALGTVPLFQRHIRIAIGSAAEAETLTKAPPLHSLRLRAPFCAVKQLPAE